MKYYYIVFLLFLILNIKFSKSQIFNGNSLDFGIFLPSRLDLHSYNLTDPKNIKSYASYDWCFFRFWLRSNDTGFIGFADIHPRVDEFTTFRVVNTQNLIFNSINETVHPNTGGGIKNVYPGWQIWMEIVSTKNITQYTSTVTEVQCSTTPNAEECKAPINGTAPTSYNVTTITNTTITVPISLPPKNIVDINTRTFVNYFAVVVQLDKGNIVDAIWDGDRLPEVCKGCDSCIDNQCGVNYKDMGCDIDNGCQLKVMVAWAGRDKNNRPCQSINKLPSNFQKYSATAIKKIGTGLLSDFFYKINNNNNNPNRA